MDAVEPQIRELLERWPEMPATVIAERIGWTRGLTVLKDRIQVQHNQPNSHQDKKDEQVPDELQHRLRPSLQICPSNEYPKWWWSASSRRPSDERLPWAVIAAWSGCNGSNWQPLGSAPLRSD